MNEQLVQTCMTNCKPSPYYFQCVNSCYNCTLGCGNNPTCISTCESYFANTDNDSVPQQSELNKIIDSLTNFTNFFTF